MKENSFYLIYLNGQFFFSFLMNYFVNCNFMTELQRDEYFI